MNPEWVLSEVESMIACRAPSWSTVTSGEGFTTSSGGGPKVMVCGKAGSWLSHSTVWPGRARLSIVQSRLGPADDPLWKTKARVAAEEALRLAPSLGEGHLALGLCLYWADKNYAAALKEFSTAAATLPNEPDILDFIAGIYGRQGRWHESLATYQRAQDLDPRNVKVINQAAGDNILVRDWPAATACFNRALEIAPDSASAKIGSWTLSVLQNSSPTSRRN